MLKVKGQRVKAKDLANGTGFGDQDVYVNDHLTVENKKILSAAKIKKRDIGAKYVWILNGNIFLRKDDGIPAIKLTSLKQLKQIK